MTDYIRGTTDEHRALIADLSAIGVHALPTEYWPDEVIVIGCGDFTGPTARRVEQSGYEVGHFNTEPPSFGVMRRRENLTGGK